VLSPIPSRYRSYQLDPRRILDSDIIHPKPLEGGRAILPVHSLCQLSYTSQMNESREATSFKAVNGVITTAWLVHAKIVDFNLTRIPTRTFTLLHHTAMLLSIPHISRLVVPFISLLLACASLSTSAPITSNDLVSTNFDSTTSKGMW
jgi:hypothetical protein